MKVIITDQALSSLKEIVLFLSESIGEEKALFIGRSLLEAAISLDEYGLKGALEPYLEHLNEQHRRKVFNKHYKIIYKITDTTLYVTDIFDIRQHPDKMKG